MEFILFLLFMFFIGVINDTRKRAEKRKERNNSSKKSIKQTKHFPPSNQKEAKSVNGNWDSSFHHKETYAHYPEFKFDEKGWSLSKVYVPKTNTYNYIDINTGDKYNKDERDYLGNKKPKLKRRISPPPLKNKINQTQSDIRTKKNEDLSSELTSSPINLVNRTKLEKNKNLASKSIEKKPLKQMWRSINPFLDFVEVDKLYHFTDKRNLKSIIENGGLYTWNGLRNRNINGYLSSNDSSHSLDKRKGLQDYVRLSFVNYHPMSTYVVHHKNIELIWLEIDRSVASLEDTLFSDMNATDNNVNVSGDFDFLKKINFEVFKNRYSSLNPSEKKQYQSEILIKEFLPLKYISNLEILKERYL